MRLLCSQRLVRTIKLHILQSVLGIVNGSYRGQVSDGRSECEFSRVKEVSPDDPVIVTTLPSIATSSTVNAESVPRLVIFVCAAVARVPAIVPPETLIPALNTGIWFIVTTPPPPPLLVREQGILYF